MENHQQFTRNLNFNQCNCLYSNMTGRISITRQHILQEFTRIIGIIGITTSSGNTNITSYTGITKLTENTSYTCTTNFTEIIALPATSLNTSIRRDNPHKFPITPKQPRPNSQNQTPYYSIQSPYYPETSEQQLTLQHLSLLDNDINPNGYLQYQTQIFFLSVPRKYTIQKNMVKLSLVWPSSNQEKPIMS